MTYKKVRTVDLFCGAGGFSTGFLLSEYYDIVAGVDFDGRVKDTFERNHRGSKFIQYDIRKKPPNEIKKIKADLIIGSPPCQGFSDARGTRYRLDPKNDLVTKFYEWIAELRPKVALMENVKGMTTIGSAWQKLDNPDKKQSIDFMDHLKSEADKIGYKFSYKLLNSAYYSVPQERVRTFCVMTRMDRGLSPKLPVPEDHVSEPLSKNKTLDDFFCKKGNKNAGMNGIKVIKKQPKTTVGQAIEGLPTPYDYRKNRDMFELTPLEVSKKKLDADTPYFANVFDSNLLYNHVAKFARKEHKNIIKHIPQGITYRSDRRGDKHIGVWDLLKDELNEEERDALLTISKLRTRDSVKTKKGRYTEGYVPYEALKEQFVKSVLDGLVEKGLLKYSKYCQLTDKIKQKYKQDKNDLKEELRDRDFKVVEKFFKLRENGDYNKKKGGIPTYTLGIQHNSLNKMVREGILEVEPYECEYDLTTKAGLRGKYSRLAYDSQSRTLMTMFSSVYEMVHPTEPRGLSLREGARLMSFPDSFVFEGSFSQISREIGNAVAPLVAYHIAEQFYEDYFKG